MTKPVKLSSNVLQKIRDHRFRKVTDIIYFLHLALTPSFSLTLPYPLIKSVATAKKY